MKNKKMKIPHFFPQVIFIGYKNDWERAGYLEGVLHISFYVRDFIEAPSVCHGVDKQEGISPQGVGITMAMLVLQINSYINKLTLVYPCS